LDEELNAKDEALRAQNKTLAEYQSQINALQAKITGRVPMFPPNPENNSKGLRHGT